MNSQVKALPRRVEVAIVGAGPAGAAVALLLARHGVSTAILGSHTRAAPRFETLPSLANPLLSRLGLSDTICGQQSFAGMISAWGSEEPHVEDFFCAGYGEGLILDRAIFDASLIEAARAAGAEVRLGTRVYGLRKEHSWTIGITLQNKHYELVATHLVDATGRARSNIFQALSPTIPCDRLIGVQGFLNAANPSPYGIVEAIEHGWLFSAAFAEKLAITFFTDADIYAASRQTPEVHLAAQLKNAPLTLSRVSGRLIPDRAVIVSAASSRRTAVCGERWIAVGDAAAALDPLSSLGIFKALDSAERAARCFMQESAKDYQNWSEVTLVRYLQKRNHFYSREQRWKGSPFWARRHKRDWTN